MSQGILAYLLCTIIKSIKHKQAKNEILGYLSYTKIINILIISSVAKILSHEHRHILGEAV